MSRRHPDETVVLEAAPSLIKNNLAGLKCLVTLQKNKAAFRLMNQTENNINLPIKTTVALVSDIDRNSVTTRHDPYACQSKPACAYEALDTSNKTSKYRHQTCRPTRLHNTQTKQDTSTDQFSNLTFALSDSDLSEERKTQLEAFIYRNKDIFSTGIHDLGQTILPSHIIETNTTKPVKMPFYRQTSAVRQENRQASK